MGQVPASPEAQKAAERTADWVKSRFRRHYEKREMVAPDRLARREFGFMFWGPGLMQRHLAFSTVAELRGFLAKRVPMHVYNSSAYYDRPDAPTMDEKGWLGADLIFDLDADHIPKAKEMTYEQMLEAVKRKIVQLHDEFLVQDFGFDEHSLRIVFSGGRGYHIHVSSERVWSLGSHERREIVDYVTGKGLDVLGFFHESAFDVKEFRGRARVRRMVVPPKADDPGWAGKLARGLRNLVDRLEVMPKDQALGFLAGFEGVGPAGASNLYDDLFTPRATQPRVIRGADRLREDGSLEALKDENRDRLLEVVRQLQQVRFESLGPLELAGIRGRAETDEPVTSDIKRLIRMPSSIHGKSGLEVVPLTRDAIDGFVPLRDAVPASYADEAVSMRISRPIHINLRSETFNLDPGLTTVPEYAAVFLACRKEATLA